MAVDSLAIGSRIGTVIASLGSLMSCPPIRVDLLELLALRTIELAKTDLVMNKFMPTLVFWRHDGRRRLVRIDTDVSGAAVQLFLPLLAEQRPRIFLLCWIRADDAICLLAVHPTATKLGVVPFHRDATGHVIAFDDLRWIAGPVHDGSAGRA